MRRLLVVDDVQDDRLISARHLELLGYECAFAEDGEAALSLISEERFDLVLLDILMPGLNGISVLKRVRETHSRDELPVIMLTIKDDARDMIEALDSGANAYVIKPEFSVAAARAQHELARKHLSTAAR